MANVLTVPNSGIISFDNFPYSNLSVPPLSSSARISYDNGGGINIKSLNNAATALDRFSVDGTQGRLFSVTDVLTGLLFSVNDITGLPLLEVYDTDTIIAGEFNSNALVVSGKNVSIGSKPFDTSKLAVSGNVNVVGNLTVTGNISGNNLRVSFNQGTATGNCSFAEGFRTTASGTNSHAEGSNTTASGTDSHSEGQFTQGLGNGSHAEGGATVSSGAYSHAEGFTTTASGSSSHAEGGDTTASGNRSHAEGDNTTASGVASHAEGSITTASGNYSHAEGIRTIAQGYTSHAAGYRTTAAQDYTYAWSDGNLGTLTQNVSTTRTGQYMISASGGMFIPSNVGIGTDSIANALTVNGNISATGTINANNITITDNLSTSVHVTDFTTSKTFLSSDTSRIFHFDTTTAPLCAIFPSTLPDGFNVAIMNTGTNNLRLSAAQLNSVGVTIGVRYGGAFVYKDNNQLFAVGRL